MALYIVFIFFFVMFVGAVALYNQLVTARVHVAEGWSGIDVQLKRRADLIPNLINTVKGYVGHEANLLKDLTDLRTLSVSGNSVKEQSQVENMLSGALRSVIAVAENYPDLKANTNFVAFQEQLDKIEHDLQLARRYYNGTVRDNNIKIDSFPSNLIATLFDFKKREFFEADDALRDSVPEVKF